MRPQWFERGPAAPADDVPGLLAQRLREGARPTLESRRLCGPRDTKAAEGERLAGAPSRLDPDKTPAARHRAWRVTEVAIWRLHSDRSEAP